MNLEISGIYQILNRINGKFYIGSAVNLNSRWSQHKYELKQNIHGNSYLQRSFNKYKIEAFEFIVLEYCEPEKLLEREQFWIDWTKACEVGYNSRIIANSNLGKKWTDDHKLKISSAKKGIPQSSEFIAKRMASIRKFDKWPHELGYRCKCNECKAKLNEMNKSYRNKPKRKIIIYSGFQE